MSERQTERAIVLTVEPGSPARADVQLLPGPGCEECGARAFCQPDGADRRRLRAVVDGERPHIGEQVEVVVSGDRILTAAIWSYGLPLAGFCLGLSLGWGLCPAAAGREAVAFAAGLAGAAVPFVILWRRTRRQPDETWLRATVRRIPSVPGAPSSRATHSST